MSACQKGLEEILYTDSDPQHWICWQDGTRGLAGERKGVRNGNYIKIRE